MWLFRVTWHWELPPSLCRRDLAEPRAGAPSLVTQPCPNRPRGLRDPRGKGSTWCPLSSAHMTEHSQEENFNIFIKESRHVVIGTLQ